jgi:hypothetical protein
VSDSFLDRFDDLGRPTYLAWDKDVRARGGVVTALPKQSGYEGILGEKYTESVIIARNMDTPLLWQRPPAGVRPAGAPPIAGITYGLYLAPLKVRALDRLHKVVQQTQITAGKAAEGAEKVATTIANASKTVVLLALIGAGVLAYAASRRR